jgi:hypothetical protein
VRDERAVGAVIGVGIGAAVILLLTRRASAMTTRSPRERSYGPAPVALSHSARAWIPLLSTLGPDIPLSTALAWIDQESAGNVCAIGNKPAPGVKYPVEYGLSQLDAHDPENAALLSQADARASCQNFGAARSDWETQLRSLTDDERRLHAAAALAHMRSARNHAQLRISGWGWDPNGIDTWKMAKLWHAGPAYVNLAPTVAKELGHPPQDFSEFQEHANAVGLRTGLTQGHMNQAWTNIANFAKRVTMPSSFGIV